MKRCSVIYASALIGASLVSGCASISGVSVPDKGHYVDAAAANVAPVVNDPENVRLRLVLSRGEGIIQEPLADKYLNGIATKLLAGWPKPSVPIPVYVIPSGSFCAEGVESNAVFIYTGVLQYLADHPQVGTEDHLAFVIAHELSHVLLGHTRDRARMQEMAHRVNGALGLAANILQRSKNSGIAGASQKAAMALLMSIEIADGALFPGLSREQENQADVLAVDLMSHAGYSLDVVTQVMDVIKASEKADEDRRRLLRTQFITTTQNSVSVQFGAVLAQAWSGLGDTHPAAVDRDSRISNYIRREYDDQSVAPHRKSFEAFLRLPAIRSMLADTQILLRANDAVLQNQPDQAASLLSRLRSRSVINSPLALTLAIITSRSPRLDTQVDNVLSNPYATKRLFEFRGHELEGDGKYERALTVYRTAYERFDAPDLLPHQIRLLRRMKRNTEATITAAKCYTLGQPDLQEACAAESKT